jgi:hypothetical protein
MTLIDLDPGTELNFTSPMTKSNIDSGLNEETNESNDLEVSES